MFSSMGDMRWSSSPPDHERKKQEALAQASQWWELEPVFLDTETTGLDDQAEVLEIAIVDTDGSVLIDTLVHPVRSISQGAKEIHGISNRMVADAPRWPEIHDDVLDILSSRPVVIYNYDFDTRIIEQTVSFHWFLNESFEWPKPRCAMKLYAQYQGSWNDFFGNYAWHKLSHAVKHLGIGLENAHRACADAEATRQLIQMLSRIHEDPALEPAPRPEIEEGWVPNSD